MPEPRDWPTERSASGSLRPWFFSAEGYLVLLFKDHEEARRAQRGLQEHGVADQDVRLHDAEQVLGIEARLQEERSPLAKAIAALTADRGAMDRYRGNARAGGSALWLHAPTHEDADRLIGLLADFDYRSLRYYGSEGVEVIRRDPDNPADSSGP
jgi:hypothetical protein